MHDDEYFVQILRGYKCAREVVEQLFLQRVRILPADNLEGLIKASSRDEKRSYVRQNRALLKRRDTEDPCIGMIRSSRYHVLDITQSSCSEQKR